MTTKPQTNTDKALAYIARHPGCRSPEIAEAIGVPASNITAILTSPVQAGYLVVCKVEQPGKVAMNEYRLSATVADDKVSWSEFRVANRARKPATEATPRPMRTTAAAKPTAPPPKAETPATIAPASAPPPAIELAPPKITVRRTAETAETPSPISAPAETESQRTLPPAADESAAKHCNLVRAQPQILFLIDSTGELRIEMPDGEKFFVSRRETQSLGRLMMATELIWR